VDVGQITGREKHWKIHFNAKEESAFEKVFEESRALYWIIYFF